MKKFQFKPIFSRRDYIILLRKYRNLLLFRGKSSLSYRLFDKVLIEFKKKYKVAPHIFMYKAIYNLVPFFGFLKQKIGFRIKSYPALITPHRRIILLLKWLVRDFKNRIFFRTRGYDVNYLANIFVQAAQDEGRASITSDNYKDAILREKFNLKKSYGKKNPLLRGLRNSEYKLRSKMIATKKEEIVKARARHAKKHLTTYAFFKKIRFLLPRDKSQRKYVLNLLNFRKYKKHPAMRKDVKKREYVKFFLFLRSIRNEKGKLKYLKWYAHRRGFHFNRKDYITKSHHNKLYFSRSLKDCDDISRREVKKENYIYLKKNKEGYGKNLTILINARKKRRSNKV